HIPAAPEEAEAAPGELGCDLDHEYGKYYAVYGMQDVPRMAHDGGRRLEPERDRSEHDQSHDDALHARAFHQVGEAHPPAVGRYRHRILPEDRTGNRGPGLQGVYQTARRRATGF